MLSCYIYLGFAVFVYLQTDRHQKLACYTPKINGSLVQAIFTAGSNMFKEDTVFMFS